MCSAGIAAAARARDGLTGRLLLQIARAETVQGKAGDAVAHALEAESIFDERDDLRGLATALRIVGNAYTYLGQLEEAAAALRRGLDLAQRVGSVEEVGGCLINLGLVELKRGALTKAIAYDRRAIEEFERIGHGSGRAIGYCNLAEKLAVAGEYVDALAHCDRALEFARSIGHLSTIADATKTQALIALRTGNVSLAEARAMEAAVLFDELGAVQDAAEARALVAEAAGLRA